MMRTVLQRTFFAAATVAVLLAAGLWVGGCGEKIMVPEPKGLFSVDAYILDAEFADASALQIASGQSSLFVLSDTALTKRDLNYGVIKSVDGLLGPAALCVDGSGELVFVFERDLDRVSWYATSDLSLLGFSDIPEVEAVVAMATNTVGIEAEPGARTFLYLSDPDAGVIHRYAFDDFNGLAPYGILARSDGDAARFVHVPAGLATDSEDSLLVCDADPARNWVIRFVGEPDLDDVTPQTDDQDPWRGHAALFHDPTCVPPAAADYVIGDAATCGQTDWVGAPSDAEGAFSSPRDVTVDGSGRIFVADTGNDRVQVFLPDGLYDLSFGDAEDLPAPESLAVVDIRIGGGTGDVDYAAYVYLVLPDIGQVRRFISSEYYIYLNQEPPPPPN
ncbi:hypothetical protein GW813_05105 [bacterium]|nr:hypothetical protein [bacterium]PIV80445.1 MAG: hypothetical protein COW53_09660 [bacterium CG17_big_fil_post_rev_8_21_14_2_50_64_8]PJA75275.1 MAG: hypothetical protein CO151_06970 [bacterium CG_4_9_14_3_um_filter_65_15]